MRAPTQATSKLSNDGYLRLWMAKPWRWRIEKVGAGSSPRQVTVIDGAWYWTYAMIPSRGYGVFTNMRLGQPKEPEYPGVDSEILTMLDPASFTESLTLRVTGGATEHGWLGDELKGSAQDRSRHPGQWPGADEYELLVEREHGILLRAEALLDGKTYARTEFTELILNQTIPDERFVFQIPDGVPVYDLGDS